MRFLKNGHSAFVKNARTAGQTVDGKCSLGAKMTHPLIDQLRFTRSEWLRGLAGVTEEDGAQHFGPMNSIGWTVGHLAWQEHRYFVERGQGKILFPQLHEVYRPGSPMTTPSLVGMRDIWAQ